MSEHIALQGHIFNMDVNCSHSKIPYGKLTTLSALDELMKARGLTDCT